MPPDSQQDPVLLSDIMSDDTDGLSRRSFLRKASAAGSVQALMACNRPEAGDEEAAQTQRVSL